MDTERLRNNLTSAGDFKDLDTFFEKKLYNSFKASDDLIKNIEKSRNERLAKKALSLYQRRFSTLDQPWRHVSFMYGLGLIYMHFNAYDWAVKAFREALYVQPNFARSRDVHTRLGLIFKAIGNYALSEKHFNLAIHDSRSTEELDEEKIEPTTTTAPQADNPNDVTNIIGNLNEFCSAEQVIEAYKKSTMPIKVDINVLDNDGEPPHMFPLSPPYPPIHQDQLFPSPPCIFLETKKDLLTKRPQDCCQSNPISIVRNIANVLKLDLGLFSTKTLVESNPNHPIEMLSHLLHKNDDGLTENSANPWASDCEKSKTIISRFANYQVSSFRNSLQEERDNKSSGSKTNLTKESETDSNESGSTQAKRLNSHSQPANHEIMHHNNNSTKTGHLNKKLKTKQPPKIVCVRAVDKMDLSDEKLWKLQLNELNKLPYLMKCVSASNMLSHIGGHIAGVNVVTIGMHVPGCRILGNRTPNNFCAVNLNVGPGDYEWYAVSAEYSSVISRLCTKNGLDFSNINWWPRLSDLQKQNVPVYRFSQRPGDLVWVNPGTVYWVQSNGWCNNIRWNVGPLSFKQYRSACESYELNKLLYQKSDVPMIQLTWNMVININYIPDIELNNAIRKVLRKSLGNCAQVTKLIDQVGRRIYHNESDFGPRRAKFCSLCECEIFNIYFSRKSDSSWHCFECARIASPFFDDYEIRQEFELSYLIKLYDKYLDTTKKILDRKSNSKREE